MSADLPTITDMTPRLVATLQGNPNRVMQSFTRAPWDGTYFEAQVDDDASNNMRISRCDTSGKVLDYAVLQGAGHGSSITAEYENGRVWIWLWWTIDPTTGAQGAPVRWAYQGTPSGSTVRLADAEPVPDPDVDAEPHTWGQFAIDQATDRIATFFRTNTTERFTLWKLSEYKAGTGEPVYRVTLTKDANASFQGFTTSDTRAYIARGGSAVTDIAPTLYELDWATGEVTATLDTSGLAIGPGGIAPGGHNEAEGVCLWRDQAGNPTLLFGITTGPTAQRQARIYGLVAPVEGTATKTVKIDAERVIGGPATNILAAFRYDRLVRYTTGGFTPRQYEDTVDLSEKDTAELAVSDHPDLTDDSFGFVIFVRLTWDDPVEFDRRKRAAYTAQLSAADPAVTLLSSIIGAEGAVPPGQIVAGRPGPRGEPGPPGVPGEPGDPSAFELRGQGSPLGTVTPASAGVYYTDTAQTFGAIRWVSTGTTKTSWIVTVGDTGWRNIAALLANGAMQGGGPNGGNERVLVRRIGNVTYCNFSFAIPAWTSGQSALTVPDGFRVPRQTYMSVDYGNTVRAILTSAGAVNLYTTAANAGIRYTWTYPTDNPWPTVLPGVPLSTTEPQPIPDDV